MADKRQKPERISEQIMEVRFAPNPMILDYRGSWVESMKELMGLAKWRITSNRIDLYDRDEGETIRAFVSFRNCGLVVQDSPTRNFFSDQAVKLLKFLFQQKAFGSSVHVARLGIRSRFATAYAGSFEELLGCYSSRYLSLSPEASAIWAAKVIDMGGGVNLETQHGKINTTSGPMATDQLKEAFPAREEVPAVALYFDLDYYREPEKQVTIDQITTSVKHFADDAWTLHDKMADLILGQGGH